MKRTLAIIITVALAALSLAAQDKDVKYSNNSFARISFVSGGTYVQRAQDLGYEEAELNAPVGEGDRAGTTNGRLEVYMGRRTYIRLDENSKIDFAALPRRDSQLTKIRQWAGHLYLDAGSMEKEKSIEILTDDATFYILDKGLYRVDVRENGSTEILVFRGMVEAAGADGSMLVKASQRLSMTDGRFEGRPASFFAAGIEDGFDTFNLTRATALNQQMARRYLPDDLSDFEGELAENGDWMNSPEFGWVWVPRGMASDWRPYSWGRWMWIPMAGWTWIPNEPWGWGPYHYGRWHWAASWGWYWIPMNMWGPAWVDWWWDYDYFGWAPMSYWGYPGIIIDNMYYGRGWRGGYPYNSRALTVVRKDQLQAGNIRKVLVSGDSLKALGTISLSPHFPTVRPTGSERLSVQPLDGGRVILRKTGEGGSATGTSEGVARKIGRDDAVTSRSGQAKTTDAKVTDGSKTDARGKTQGGQTATTKTTGVSNTGERKIRKKEGGSYEAGGSAYGSRIDSYGYPSSSSITRDGTPSQRRSSGSTLRDDSRRSSSGVASSSSRGSSSSSGSSDRSSGSSSRSSGSSSSRGSSSSSSHGGGGSSHSSGGGGRHK